MQRIEGGVLVAILVVVGAAAGAASFTHMHDWTMANSPEGTPGWFGWANACISELVPVAALLDLRRRRRQGRPVGYPMTLLVAGIALSLATQLAVAVPSPSGWLLSAVPALAFMCLVKLVFSATPAPAREPIEQEGVPTSQPARPVRPPVVPQGVTLLDIIPAHPGVPEQAPSVTPVPVRAVKRHYRAKLTDAEIVAALRDPQRVPRRNGRVSIKAAVEALGIGPDRARRLLDETGLRATPQQANGQRVDFLTDAH